MVAIQNELRQSSTGRPKVGQDWEQLGSLGNREDHQE